MAKQISDLITKDLKPAVLAAMEDEQQKSAAEHVAKQEAFNVACAQEIQARADLVNAAFDKIEARGITVNVIIFSGRVWWPLPGKHNGCYVWLESDGRLLVREDLLYMTDEAYCFRLDRDNGHNWLVTKGTRESKRHDNIEYLVAGIQALQAFVAG